MTTDRHILLVEDDINLSTVLADYLRSKGIATQLQCYGSEDDHSVGHVFHLNLNLPEATSCNDDQCAFFRSVLATD